MGSAAIPHLPKLYARGLPPTVLTLEMDMLLFDMLCIEKGVLVAMPVLDIGLSICADRPPAGFALAKVPGPRRAIVGAETKGAPAMERVPARYPGRPRPNLARSTTSSSPPMHLLLWASTGTRHRQRLLPPLRVRLRRKVSSVACGESPPGPAR